jgi:hypothetical protein
MIQHCLCGPAIDVLHTTDGDVYARLLRRFVRTADPLWRDVEHGKVSRCVRLECLGCGSLVSFDEVNVPSLSRETAAPTDVLSRLTAEFHRLY